MQATMSQTPTDGIFNFGSILGRIGNTAIDALQHVAPVWLEQQLNLDEPRFTGTNNPTFQNTGADQPDANLTTNIPGLMKDGKLLIPQQTLLLFGGGAVLVMAFLLLKD